MNSIFWATSAAGALALFYYLWLVRWEVVAAIVSHPAVARWLITRSKRTPYSHVGLEGQGGIYMYRYWLFNPYSSDFLKQEAGSDVDTRRYTWLPSIRIHGIMRPDRHPDKHNHPWNYARTIVLHNAYAEIRDLPGTDRSRIFWRNTGDTAALNGDVFHRIVRLKNDAPVWTLFITWKKAGSWYFKKDGVNVPWREYLKRF